MTVACESSSCHLQVVTYAMKQVKWISNQKIFHHFLVNKKLYIVRTGTVAEAAFLERSRYTKCLYTIKRLLNLLSQFVLSYASQVQFDRNVIAKYTYTC